MREALEKISGWERGSYPEGEPYPDPGVLARSALTKAAQAEPDPDAELARANRTIAGLRQRIYWEERTRQRHAGRAGRFKAERDRARAELERAV